MKFIDYKELSLKNKEYAQINEEKILILLEELVALMKDDDFEASKKIDEILEVTGNYKKDEFMQIRKYVQDYDFEEALVLAHRLIERIMKG